MHTYTPVVHNIRPLAACSPRKPCQRLAWLATVLFKNWPVWCFRLTFLCKFMAAFNGSIPVHSKLRYFQWLSIIRLTTSFKVHHFHFFSLYKKDGYRQQNVRQRQKLISIIDYDVCILEYLEPFWRYSTSKNGLTLKSGYGVLQGQWKRRGSIEHVWLSISPLL